MDPASRTTSVWDLRVPGAPSATFGPETIPVTIGSSQFHRDLTAFL